MNSDFSPPVNWAVSSPITCQASRHPFTTRSLSPTYDYPAAAAESGVDIACNVRGLCGRRCCRCPGSQLPGTRRFITHGGSESNPATIPAPEIQPPTIAASASAVKNADFYIFGGTCHMEGDVLALTAAKQQCIFNFWPTNWSNYDFSFQFMTNDQETARGFHVGIHVLEGNAMNVWLADFDNTSIELNRRYNGTPQRIQLVPYRFEPDRWYPVRVQVRGPEVKCFINDQEYLSGRDDGYTHGRLQIATFNSADRFRDIKVTAPDGTTMWQGVPDLSQLPANQIDPPNSVHLPDSGKTDLIKTMNLAADTQSGSWTTIGNGITGQGTNARIQFHSPLPPEYDYRVSFVRNSGNGPIALVASANGRPFAWVIGGHDGTLSGFGMLSGKDYDVNPTTIVRPTGLRMVWLTRWSFGSERMPSSDTSTADRKSRWKAVSHLCRFPPNFTKPILPRPASGPEATKLPPNRLMFLRSVPKRSRPPNRFSNSAAVHVPSNDRETDQDRACGWNGRLFFAIGSCWRMDSGTGNEPAGNQFDAEFFAVDRPPGGRCHFPP